VEKMRTRYSELEGQIDGLSNLSRSSVPVLDILRDLSDIIPESAWVARLSVSGMDVKIDGYADLASQLITLLEESPIFSDVAFLSTITKTRDGKERFRIGLKAQRSNP